MNRNRENMELIHRESRTYFAAGTLDAEQTPQQKLQFQVQVAIMKKDEEKVTELMMIAKANNYDKFFKSVKWSPIKFAVIKCRVNIVSRLLKLGCNPNECNVRNRTILHSACERDYFLIAKLLVQYKADINCIDKKGETPIYLTARKGITKISKLLLDFNETKQICNINIDTKDQNFTPLIVACEHNNIEIAKLLLSYDKLKVDINAKDWKGNTALIKASGSGNNDIVKLLLQYNADINAKNKWGQSALIVAIQTKNNKVIKTLLGDKQGINLWENDNRGNNIFYYINKYLLRQGNMEMTQKIIKQIRDELHSLLLSSIKYARTDLPNGIAKIISQYSY